jgi:DNA-binding transcriptional LysR family regulator
MDLHSVETFVAVIQAGNFSKAAIALNVTKSTVSKKVSDLEAVLGSPLLRRTTRSLQLTDLGAEFFQRCQLALAQIREATDFALEKGGKARGKLRVTAPSDFATNLLAPIFAGFMRAYPEVILELVLTDKPLDLIADSIDVAIRIGSLKDSALRARSVGKDVFKLVASPYYLKAAVTLKAPSDLKNHPCLIFAPKPGMSKWRLRKGASRIAVEPTHSFTANNITSVKSMVMLGLGISLLPVSNCLEEIDRKKLVVVLPDWSMEEAPIHLVYQKHAFTAPKITAFLDYMSLHMKEIFA